MAMNPSARSFVTVMSARGQNICMKLARIEDAGAALADFAREPLPYEAGFLTGKAFLAFRKRAGTSGGSAKRSTWHFESAARGESGTRPPSEPRLCRRGVETDVR